MGGGSGSGSGAGSVSGAGVSCRRGPQKRDGPRSLRKEGKVSPGRPREEAVGGWEPVGGTSGASDSSLQTIREEQRVCDVEGREVLEAGRQSEDVNGVEEAKVSEAPAKVKDKGVAGRVRMGDEVKVTDAVQVIGLETRGGVSARQAEGGLGVVPKGEGISLPLAEIKDAAIDERG